MIRGYCIGGGTAVAVGCDIRIASDDARFGVPAAKLGLGYRFDGIKRLASIVGPSFTAEIFFTGRQFTAQEALQMGLVNRVLPVGELESYTLDYANTIAGNAPLTIAAVKRSLIELQQGSLRSAISRLCQSMVDACFAERGLQGRADRVHGKAQAAVQGPLICCSGSIQNHTAGEIMAFDANRPDLTVGVIGTGAMGRGIVQVAAAGGMQVLMTDSRPGAAAGSA